VLRKPYEQLLQEVGVFSYLRLRVTLFIYLFMSNNQFVKPEQYMICSIQMSKVNRWSQSVDVTHALIR
jgi:hypothetical protein